MVSKHNPVGYLCSGLWWRRCVSWLWTCCSQSARKSIISTEWNRSPGSPTSVLVVLLLLLKAEPNSIVIQTLNWFLALKWWMYSGRWNKRYTCTTASPDTRRTTSEICLPKCPPHIRLPNSVVFKTAGEAVLRCLASEVETLIVLAPYIQWSKPKRIHTGTIKTTNSSGIFHYEETIWAIGRSPQRASVQCPELLLRYYLGNCRGI